MEEKESKKEVLKNLTAPLKIGPFELRNRIALAPMNETMAGANGECTYQEVCYYGTRAKGGTALVTTGAIMGTRLGSRFVWGRNMYCFNAGHLQGLGMLTTHIHYFGGLASAQMSMGFGRQGHSYDEHELAPAPTAGLPYEAAVESFTSGIGPIFRKSEKARQFLIGQQTREMSISEIQSEQKEYAASCQLAVTAGFDMIEIHGPHGYLEHEFLSPLSNKRTDMYGGEWRNRKRLINDTMDQVRYACPGVAVGVRISAEEHQEGGLTREEMIDLARDLEARGADFISLSDGGGYEETSHLVGTKEVAEHIPDAGADFKKALKIPVIVASQHDPIKADADIGAGKFDVSALARQLFVDPEYANKVMEGRQDEIIRCKRCNICLMRCLSGITPECPQNPWLGREYANPDYGFGARQKHESILMKGMQNAPMPALDKPWWKKEFPLMEKNWRGFRGPGARWSKEEE
ncbi:MAG: NADH:flavin oxidoreductase [Deltaproteobacteria bacterium]|nr:NADH:flavin oxidoreductase [Deltaproteobacteria bacterium]